MHVSYHFRKACLTDEIERACGAGKLDSVLARREIPSLSGVRFLQNIFCLYCFELLFLYCHLFLESKMTPYYFYLVQQLKMHY